MPIGMAIIDNFDLLKIDTDSKYTVNDFKPKNMMRWLTYKTENTLDSRSVATKKKQKYVTIYYNIMLQYKYYHFNNQNLK